MLEREELIRREEGVTRGAHQGSYKDLLLVIPSGKQESSELEPRGAPGPLQVSTVLHRAPKVFIELVGGRSRVSLGGRQGHAINGGAHALSLLDAFERPRAVQEVVRVLQRKVQGIPSWIGLVESLVRLFEGGVLYDVRQNRRGGHVANAAQAAASSGGLERSSS